MKVFGYPKFDENNEKILTTYDNEYQSMMMDVRVYRMSAGETRVFQKAEEETAILLLSGNVVYHYNGFQMILFLTQNFINQKTHLGDILV